MARYLATVDAPGAPPDVFSYLSDFSHAQEWDPGVVEATRLDDGPIAVGSRFRLLAEFLGRTNELTYVVEAIEPPRTVTFRAETPTVVSLDTIRLEPHGAGTRVAYDADLRLKGALRVADPLFGLALRRIGDRARDGMRATLAALPARSR